MWLIEGLMNRLLPLHGIQCSFFPAVGGGSSGVDIGDNIPYSLMLDSGASQYLLRTFGAPTNNTTWTYSLWIKRGKLSASLNAIFGAAAQVFYMPIADTLITNNGGTVATSSGVFRDPIGHDHIQIVSNGTTVKVYQRGVEVSSYTGTMASINSASNHFIGRDPVSAALYGDGLFSQIIFVDGQALAPTAFGRISADTLQWVNKNYTGSYGANGFKLEFKNSANLGEDTSGNGNNWTLNGGINSTNQTADTPTNNCASGNPLHFVSAMTAPVWSKGNTRFAGPSGSSASVGFASIAIPQTGSWAWEIKPVGGVVGSYVGVCSTPTYNAVADIGYGANDYAYRLDTGQKRNNNSPSSYATAVGTTDTLGFVFDADARTLTAYMNGTSLGVMFSSIPAGIYVPAFDTYNGQYWDVLVGSRPLTYSYGTAKALCTANLPTPAILNPEKHHYVVTLSKSGDTSFTLPWDATAYDTLFEIKRRDSSGNWYQIDGLRGYDKVLSSNSTAAETTDANVIGVSGTTITLKSTLPNGSYLVRCYKAGLASARQTNTNGSITSTVSANVLAGFSIVTYTGTGANATVGHELSKALEKLDVKSRSLVRNWSIGSSYLSSWVYALYLNSTSAQTSIPQNFNSTAPTSTVFSVGAGSETNNSTDTYVAYCRHSVEGYSWFGKSTGNGSADGVSDYAGLKPMSVDTKRTDAASFWCSLDAARNPNNVANLVLYPNSNIAEGGVDFEADFTVGSLKLRTADAESNASGGTYIRAIYGTSIKFATAR